MTRLRQRAVNHPRAGSPELDGWPGDLTVSLGRRLGPCADGGRACVRSLKDMLLQKRMDRQLRAARGELEVEKAPVEVGQLLLLPPAISQSVGQYVHVCAGCTAAVPVQCTWAALQSHDCTCLPHPLTLCRQLCTLGTLLTQACESRRDRQGLHLPCQRSAPRPARACCRLLRPPLMTT